MLKMLLLVCTALLVACSHNKSENIIMDGKPEGISRDFSHLEDPIPQYERWSPTVNPKSYQVLGKKYYVLASNEGYREKGIASWYGTKFHHKKTATGEVYDMYQLTAAHKTLPIPSYVRVTNLKNQREIIVRINDRGPFHDERIIDLSYAAAIKLGLEKTGTEFVEISAISVKHPELEPIVIPVLAEEKKIYLQIGAFGLEKNALLLLHKVTTEHLMRSRIIVGKAPNNLYKVQLGPVSSQAKAEIIKAKMKNIGIQSSLLIME